MYKMVVLIIILFLHATVDAGNYNEEIAKGKFRKLEDYEKAKKQYDYIDDYYVNYNLIRVRNANRWGLIDKRLNIVVQLKYTYIYAFREGLAIVEVNKKFGFIDIKGKELVSPKYDEIGFFNNGFASIKLQGKWGLIDKNGREIIFPKYDEIGSPNWSYDVINAKLNGYNYTIDLATGLVKEKSWISPFPAIKIKNYLSLGPTFLLYPELAFGGEVSFILLTCDSDIFTGIYTDFLHETESGINRLTIGPEIGLLNVPFTFGIDGGLVLSSKKFVGFTVRPFISLGLTPIMIFPRITYINDAESKEITYQLGVSIKIPIKISNVRCGHIIDY